MAGRVMQKFLSFLPVSPALFGGREPYCLLSNPGDCFSIIELRNLNATLEGRLSIPDGTSDVNLYGRYSARRSNR